MKKTLLTALLTLLLVASAPPAQARPLSELKVRALVARYMQAGGDPYVIERCRVGRAHAWCRVSWYGYVLYEDGDPPSWWGDTVLVDTVCGKRVVWSEFTDDNPLLRRCH